MSVGASAQVTAVDAGIKGKVGSENNNFEIAGDIAAGKAKASAEAKAGKINGKMQANVSLGAEVSAAEANFAVGGKVGGVEMKAGASLKAGLGANVKASYKDGKLSFDASAAVGLGVGVKFDVDIASAAKGVANVATKGWKAVKKLFS